MADVALISVITSGSVGIGGLVFGFWNAKEERASRREDRDHSRRVAREERIYERRTEVYEDMLAQLEREVVICERTYPVLGPAPEPPDNLTDDEWMRLKARVSVSGSLEVHALVGDFYDVGVQFTQGWRACQMLEQAGERGKDFAVSFSKLNEAREKLRSDLLPKIERRVWGSRTRRRSSAPACRSADPPWNLEDYLKAREALKPAWFPRWFPTRHHGAVRSGTAAERGCPQARLGSHVATPRSTGRHERPLPQCPVAFGPGGFDPTFGTYEAPANATR